MSLKGFRKIAVADAMLRASPFEVFVRVQGFSVLNPQPQRE